MKSDFSDSSSDRDGEDPEELGWSEFQWESYFREQEDLIHRYLGWYEQLLDNPDRIDATARLMGWDEASVSTMDEPDAQEEAQEELSDGDWEPYTIHRNPVYIATRALFLSLLRTWERIASDPDKVPQPVAVAMLGSLHKAEQHSTMAIQALDLGDYTMAISLFKRALQELNRTMGILDDRLAEKYRFLSQYRDFARSRLFDLREVWLRVIGECREEVARQSGSRGDGEDV